MALTKKRIVKNKVEETPIIKVKRVYVPRKLKSIIPAGLYTVTLSVNVSDVFTSSSDNLVDAILNLKPTVQIKTKVILIVEHDGRRAEKMLFARDLKRPLVNRDAATFLAKQLIMRLK